MACGRRRRRREDGAVEPEIATGPPCLESSRFFKIILSDALESGKLGIPKSFLRRFGKDLSSSVLLKVPGGSTWTIELEKHKSDVVSMWKGWREFTEHYSIGHGHLIVFKYKGNSTFRVIIFNKSASEIDYLSSSGKTSNLGGEFLSPKKEDVVEAEDLEYYTPPRRMRVEPHLPCSQLSSSCSAPGSEDGITQSKCQVSHSELVFDGPTHPGLFSGFELASEFESKYPFFKVVMRPSYLNKLYVPRRFIMQHIQEIKEIVTLRYSGRSWPVKLRSYRRPDRGVIFSSGWSTFMRETRLRVGNVCVFELIDGDDIEFRVYIFNGAGGKEHSECTANHSEPVFQSPTPLRPLTTPELAHKFGSEHPFFKMVIPRSYMKRLSIPGGFIKKHIQEKQRATLRYSDRSWPVKLVRSYRRIGGAPSLSFSAAGWCAFARETHLRVGNVCVFKLIDRVNVVFKVSILSGAVPCRNEQSKHRVNDSEPVFHGPTPPKPLTAPELASEFDSEHPFFKVVIQQYHQSKVDVPGRFAKQHIQENKEMATLRFSDRSWLVKLLSYPHETRDRVFFSAGWPAFARETHLCLGNICVFELIDRDDVVFLVSIFSSAGGIRQSTCKTSCSEPDFHGPTLSRRPKSPELASNIELEHPFFKLVIPRSYIYSLGVPVGFTNQHIQKNKQIATLRCSDRSWPVKLIRTHGRSGETYLSFSAGWRAFARENHLRAGYVCVFELIDKYDAVFEVSILSGASNDPIPVD